MAEYKKKKIKKTKRKIKNEYVENIPMKPVKTNKDRNKKVYEKTTEQKPRKEKIRLIKSKKSIKIKRKKSLILSVISIILITIIVAFEIFTTGVFEYINNSLALFGGGFGYPVSLSSDGLHDVVNKDNYYITVTTNSINGYNKSGKELFKYQHGFEMPVIKTSSSRFLLYNQGGTDYSVYNLKNNLKTGNTDNAILGAYICKNGNYVIATLSNSYASELTVYNERHNIVYQWFCADYTINDVVLSADGKKLAVSAFTSRDGALHSKIFVLEYNSATPINTLEFSGEMIYALGSSFGSGFYAVFDNSIKYYNFKNLKSKEFTTDSSIAYFRNNNKYGIVVSRREANKNANNITVLNKKGVQKATFEFNNFVNDIAIKGNYIYILSDRMIYLYNVKGELLNSVVCEFGIEKIVPIGNFKVALLTENSIKKIDAKQGE